MHEISFLKAETLDFSIFFCPKYSGLKMLCAFSILLKINTSQGISLTQKWMNYVVTDVAPKLESI